MKIQLTDSERSAIRAMGGLAYVAILNVRGARGKQYRPVRSDLWRTQEQAERALADLRRRFVGGRQLHAGSNVHLIDANGEVA